MLHGVDLDFNKLLEPNSRDYKLALKAKKFISHRQTIASSLPRTSKKTDSQKKEKGFS